MEGLTLTQREQTRLQVLNRLVAQQLTIREAAAILGLSERHTLRMPAAHRKEGAAALAHGEKGRRSPNAVWSVLLDLDNLVSEVETTLVLKMGRQLKTAQLRHESGSHNPPKGRIGKSCSKVHELIHSKICCHNLSSPLRSNPYTSCSALFGVLPSSNVASSSRIFSQPCSSIKNPTRL